MRRTTGDVQVDGQEVADAVVTSGEPRNGPPPMAQAPEAITSFGAGSGGVGCRAGRRACSRVTGPVTSRPSAWRGEATNWMPKRPRSKTRVSSTLMSASQALHPPAKPGATSATARTGGAFRRPAPRPDGGRRHRPDQLLAAARGQAMVAAEIQRAVRAGRAQPRRRGTGRGRGADRWPCVRWRRTGNWRRRPGSRRRSVPGRSAGAPRKRSGSTGSSRG